jgi:hypothetical protein
MAGGKKDALMFRPRNIKQNITYILSLSSKK